MRPLRLHLDNFTSFREPTTIDFADVDYFALAGPTGAGKSTVIDAMCFALYGTVPRWGNENAVAPALAPTATSGRVALVFEIGKRRYAAVRVLSRGRQRNRDQRDHQGDDPGKALGTVGTREARLDELDRSISPHAGLTELLEAVVRPVAEGDAVTDAVRELTGLDYRHFTQCAILPQGRFADFLHAAPRERQDLLVQLLDAGVYEQIRQCAVREEKTAEQAAALARDQRKELTDADEAAEQQAGRRVLAMQALVAEVDSMVESLGERERDTRELGERLAAAERERAALDRLAMPRYVPQLGESVRAAAEEEHRLAEEARRREDEEARTEAAAGRAGDPAPLRVALDAHQRRDHLATERRDQQAQLAAEQGRVERLAAQLEEARREFAEAQSHRESVRDAHAAADLAARLAAGEPCPVCLRPVTELPDHPPPAAVEEADRRLGRKRKAAERLERDQRQVEGSIVKMQQACEGLRAQLDELVPVLEGHPDPVALEQRVAAIEAAEKEARNAREAAREARRHRDQAARRAKAAREKSGQAWRELGAARDTVVALGAPPLDREDPHRAWTQLLAWRDETVAERRHAVADLSRQLEEAQRAYAEQRDDVVARLERDGVVLGGGDGGEGSDVGDGADAHDGVDSEGGAVATPTAISGAVAAEKARAEAALVRVRESRARARELTERIEASEEEARVAHELAWLLRANSFEKWLCSEALVLLVTAASDTLRELSGGQYELTVNERSDIEVVDYTEAGMRRSVRTLSGGETFQTSLALALALSEQVSGLGAAAARSLDSVFLDEGFGALDPAALDTVATALERLAAGGDRMVGVVTHVPELAERVPVRFEVTRDDRGSHVTPVPAK